MTRTLQAGTVFLVLSAGFLANVSFAQPSTAPNIPHAVAIDSGLGNKPEKLEWLQDAGFGMFIHWSLDSQIGSVISHSMAGASDRYLDWFINELPKTFHPKRWDPDEVAALANVCGMQYVVLTAKHHSGFCLWDTKTTDFNITNTPYGKDMLPQTMAALRRHGLKVGLYKTLGVQTTDGGKLVFDGELLELAGAEQVHVGFEYQVYGGFATAMHNTTWTRTRLEPKSEPGRFQVEVSGLKPGTEYQFRAIVQHPQITMHGDHQQVQAK